MNRKRKARLEAAGFKVGNAADFLGLSKAENSFVELKIQLSAALSSRRKALRISQAALAKRLGSSQSRIAKMEASDPTVSVDLLMRSLLRLGLNRRDIARAIAPPKRVDRPQRRTRKAAS